MSLLSKPILIIILTALLALYFAESSAQVIIEAKKAYEINSPKVCGDRLCSETSSESQPTKIRQKNTDSPLGQYSLGLTLDKIRCKADYQLVIKAVNWHPACVKPSNVQKLIEIGWAVSMTEQKDIIKLAKSGYSFDVVERLGIPQPNATQLEPQSLLNLDFGLNIQPDIQDWQRYLIFTGYVWMGTHVITIQITNNQD